MTADSIALDELRADGDLSFAESLYNLRIDDRTTFAFWVDHNLEAGPYGMVQSVMSIRPLSTSIAPLDRDSLVWRKPSGGRLVLGLATQDTPNLPHAPEPLMGGEVLSRRPHSMYSRGGVFALVGAEFGWALVYDSEWWLYYEAGQLRGLQTPAGTYLDVHSSGGRISSLSLGGKVLLAFTINDSSKAVLRIANRLFEVEYSDRGILSNMRSGSYHLELFCGVDGLLNSVSVSGRTRRYAWQKSPRGAISEIDWLKPVFLHSVDDSVFGYECGHSEIRLEKQDHSGRERTLRMHLRYGSITSISEGDN